MRSAGRRVPLGAKCHAMAEMTYIRLQRKDKERQGSKQERERERKRVRSQPNGINVPAWMSYGRMRQAKQKCQLVQRKRETASKRESAGVRDRQRERQRGSHLAETWQLAAARATLPPAALIARKPRKMESVEGEREREETVEPCHRAYQPEQQRAAPRRQAARQYLPLPLLLLPALAVLLTHCKASNNEAQTHLH